MQTGRWSDGMGLAGRISGDPLVVVEFIISVMTGAAMSMKSMRDAEDVLENNV